uniref:Mannose-1-phosphate guanyltransferase C-terminal domain-containing protein n=1 Tax=Parascaris equorum TaxID=6256 RepID=A0A914RFV5_PAREQ
MFHATDFLERHRGVSAVVLVVSVGSLTPHASHDSPNVVIGPRVRIENGVCLRHCTILSDSIVRTHSWINSSIVGRKASVLLDDFS